MFMIYCLQCLKLLITLNWTYFIVYANTNGLDTSSNNLTILSITTNNVPVVVLCLSMISCKTIIVMFVQTENHFFIFFWTTSVRGAKKGEYFKWSMNFKNWYSIDSQSLVCRTHPPQVMVDQAVTKRWKWDSLWVSQWACLLGQSLGDLMH